MVNDTQPVPNFIRLLEPEPTYYQRKVYVHPKNDLDVGFYQLKILTSLASKAFQVGLKSHEDFFNVTVVAYPYQQRNMLVYPRQPLPV